ncbi:MAG TPA: YceI family protein [Rhodothermales bacterium]|nr:YceI family protein [Rhodothermales bacterium]
MTTYPARLSLAIAVLGLVVGASTGLAQTPPPMPDPADELGGAVYELDTQHSLLDFTARHLGFGRVRGTFNEYRAAVFFTPQDLTQSMFRMVAQTASLDTQHPGRDDLLQREFFAAEEYPYLTFTSQAIRPRGDGYVMQGDLQIRDVTRTVEIPFSVITLDGRDQWQNRRIAFEGHLTINRNDYNVVYDNDFWNGIVSDSIQIDISFAAARYNALNEIFPWREQGIGTMIRDGIDTDGLEATLARVRTLYGDEREAWSFDFRQFYRAGRALYQLERFDEAEAVFVFALDLLADSADAAELADFHLSLAEVAWARRKREAAQAHLQHALNLDAMNPAAYVLSQHMQ